MLREENFKTTLGIDTPASRWLWDMVSSEEKLELMKFFGKYSKHLKQNKDDGYIIELVYNDFLNKAVERYQDKRYYSLVKIVIKTLKKLRKLN